MRASSPEGTMHACADFRAARQARTASAAAAAAADAEGGGFGVSDAQARPHAAAEQGLQRPGPSAQPDGALTSLPMPGQKQVFQPTYQIVQPAARSQVTEGPCMDALRSSPLPSCSSNNTSEPASSSSRCLAAWTLLQPPQLDACQSAQASSREEELQARIAEMQSQIAAIKQQQAPEPAPAPAPGTPAGDQCSVRVSGLPPGANGARLAAHFAQ